MDSELPKVDQRSSWRLLLWLGILVCFCAVSLVFLGIYVNTPPENFPTEERVVIPEGASLSDISFLLKNNHFIRSGFAFRALVLFQNKENAIHSGSYMFHQAYPLTEMVRSFVSHSALVPPVKVTIPEGSTLADFDARISSALPNIAPGAIRTAAHNEEGVLFPDTYLFTETDTADDIVQKLRETFTKKLQPFEDDFTQSSSTKEEIIILASIIEKEAADAESMHIVSGILQKRLAKRMPLQVDATFAYTLHKTSAELTLGDLQTDSPYNTYTNRGLPPTPIASPGIVAIEAALHPTESPYLYYLTDKEGVFHYAKTFDEHKANKARYLR